MSKIYMSADIEGVCGIADWKEADLADPQSVYFRAQMTQEVRVACEAALGAGASEIFLKDAHGSGRNIDPSVLPECIRIMRAWTEGPFSMMAGIDSTFDAAMFIGYHSGASSDGNPLAHTMMGHNIRVLVNGEEASEFLINAYTAASVGVPVVMLSGDRQLCERAASLNHNIRTVAVNEGIGNAVVSIHPKVALANIREAVSVALRDPSACRITLPDRFDVALEFKQAWRAYRGSFYPGARQTGPTTVGYQTTTWMDALRFFFFVWQ